MTQFSLKNLPITQSIETQKVLKIAMSANRALANLNGVVLKGTI